MPRFKKKKGNDYSIQEQDKGLEPIRPRNSRQELYLKYLYKLDQVFTLGPAGTGKTFLAASIAADMLKTKAVQKIVVCRPTVGADEDLGYLPGNINMKMHPWCIPVMEDIEKRLGQQGLTQALRSNRVEIAPLAFMRGRTFDNSFVILDEAQNTNYNQIKMFLTRIGENSKVVVNGDLSQSDLKKNSGFAIALDIIRKQGLPIGVVEFTDEDVVRSEACAIWSSAFKRYEECQ